MLPDLLRQALCPDEPRYLRAQVALVMRNLGLGLAASGLVALLLAYQYQALTGRPGIWWWGLSLAALGCVGAWLGRQGLPTATDAALRRATRTLSALALAVGLGWCVLILVFMKTPDPYTTALVIAAAAGANSGGMMLFAPIWPLALVFLSLTAPPAALVLLSTGQSGDQVMGVSVLIYTAFMAAFSYHAARAVRESIELRFENAELVARLRDQSQRALEARQMAEEALHDAEDANRAKVIFLAAASHDLRQPLHALGLFANALGRTPLSPRQRGLLSQVEASADAARDMLSTLLDFSKVDAGAMAPQPQVVALQGLLHRLEQEFAPQAAERGLVYRHRDTASVVLADPALVERILRNLISNALRYTERGGVLVGVRQRAGMALVEVWDTGVGIPSHQHQAVFREFHQLGNPERDRRKGLGLGLAIVEGLARAMSVEVSLASVPGRGSVFRLHLPLSRDALMAVDPALAQVVDLAGARVLVIDDDESVRAAMAELFTSWGAWCEVVDSADDALALLARFVPQAIVADYRLRSHRHGQEAIEMVRRHVRSPVPAVLVTGDTGVDRIRQAEEGGVRLLHKPVPANLLYAVLTDLLRQGQEPAPPASAPAVAPTTK